MQKQSVRNQYFAAIVVGLFKLTDGMLIGWVSPNLLLLKTSQTPLKSGITEDEATWIASLMPVGSTVGTLVYGMVVNKFGRKFPLIALLVPSIIGWLLTVFAQNVYFLYVARLILGFTIGASYVVTPVYVVEIADDRVRGILGSTINVNEQIGVLIAYAIGGFCHYRVLPTVAMILNLLFGLLFFWFPETPAFLVKQNKMQQTEKSIRFYRNVRNGETILTETAIEQLKKAVTSMDLANVKKRLKMSDLITRPGSKALVIVTVLVLLNQFTGLFTLMNYSADIFKSSGSALSENVSSVIVQVIQTIGSFFVTSLVEKSGRRFLYIASCIGCTLGYVVMGAYMSLKYSSVNVDSFTWIPIASLSFILFIGSWALSSLTFPVAAELLPENLREFGITYCAVLLGLSATATLKSYGLLKDSIGEHCGMFFFAVVCALGAAYIFKALPESKGKSYEEIMNKLM